MDGKIDFSAPKSPVKKVGKSPAAVKRKKKIVAKDSESEPEEDDEEEEEDARPVRKRSKVKTPVVKSKAKAQDPKTKVKMRDASSQTSPAFVKKARQAAKSRKANPEMDEFVEKSVKAAAKASKNGSKAVKGGDVPTPAMLEQMEKLAAKNEAKNKRGRKK